MKKVVVLYDSGHRDMKKVAMLLTRGLEAGNVYVDCISVRDFDIRELNKYDVIGIGVSSHLFRFSKQMRLLLAKFNYIDLKNKVGFVFEIKRCNILAASVAKRIKRNLKKRNVKFIHPIITCVVSNKEGPLKSSNSHTIEQIGLLISEKLKSK